MTDSRIEETGTKRERLAAGARDVIRQQGVEKTTIADIARAADVPVGNVYYYFKTKDELVAAAIDSHRRDIHALLASLERHRTPAARLMALVRELTAQRELAARHGGPLGSLCSELDKRTDGLDRACARHRATDQHLPRPRAHDPGGTARRALDRLAGVTSTIERGISTVNAARLGARARSPRRGMG